MNRKGALCPLEHGERLIGEDMSEEQPQFKVTDRRLFNPDGTPRELTEEEAAEQKKSEERERARQAAAAEAASRASTPESVESQPERRPGGAAAAPAAAAPRAETGGRAARDQEPSAPEDDVDTSGVHDPASFVNFLMSIASNAAAALGMMEHPVTGERGVDLELGKHWIDVLGMLEEKTRGNLNPQEQQILEGLLSDLRMQFVSLANTTPASKQRFTGRDITGGR